MFMKKRGDAGEKGGATVLSHWLSFDKGTQEKEEDVYRFYGR